MNRTASLLASLVSCAGLAVLTIPAAAQTVTLNFDSQSTGPFTTLTESGYTLTFAAGDNEAVQNVGGSNQNVLVDSNPNNFFGAEVTIARTDAGTFSLTGLDIANLDNINPIQVQSGSGFRIELNGSTGGNDVYGPASSTFITVHPSDLTDVTSVSLNIVSATFLREDFAVDNIVLQHTAAVPEPGSLAFLTGSMLTGTAFLRRRKQAGKFA